MEAQIGGGLELIFLRFRIGTCLGGGLELLWALTMQDSITESKSINYILFMVFC